MGDDVLDLLNSARRRGEQAARAGRSVGTQRRHARRRHPRRRGACATRGSGHPAGRPCVRGTCCLPARTLCRRRARAPRPALLRGKDAPPLRPPPPPAPRDTRRAARSDLLARRRRRRRRRRPCAGWRAGHARLALGRSAARRRGRRPAAPRRSAGAGAGGVGRAGELLRIRSTTRLDSHPPASRRAASARRRWRGSARRVVRG